MNKLLERQLKKYFKDYKNIQEDLKQFLQAVNDAYDGFDIDRNLMEHAFDLSSDELISANKKLENEILERKKIENELRENQELLKATIESTADGILVVGKNGKIKITNIKFAQMWKIPEKLLKLKDDNILLAHVADQLIDPEKYLAVIKKLYESSEEVLDKALFKDGKIFERYSAPLITDSENVGRIWSFRDITKQKLAEEKIKKALEEKSVLLSEIHHRVKNNLQVISSLLNMHSEKFKNTKVKETFKDCINRINTMALIHTQLYEVNDISNINVEKFSSDLIKMILCNYNIRNLRIDLDIKIRAIYFPINIAVPFGLILNELVSNIVKYAFTGKFNGKIKVHVDINKLNEVNLLISDNGCGLPASFDMQKNKTLGIRLVKILSEKQLMGNLKFISNTNGTTYKINFKLNR